MIDVSAVSTAELLVLRDSLKVASPATFADLARKVLQQGLAAAYVAGQITAVATKKPVPPVVPTPVPTPTVAPTPATPDPSADNWDETDWYDNLDDDGQQAVDDASDGFDWRLLGLGALLVGGAVSSGMFDSWMGTYAAGLNPLFEDGFQAGVATLGEVEQATWVSEDDPATCDECQALDGMTWVGAEIDAGMPMPGDSRFGGRTACGPNCFVAGTLVEGRFVSGMRSWYVGELIELRTMRGHRLTVTPNHPIATPSGFVPANSIVKGDYVLSQAVVIDSLEGLDMKNAPAAIEQVLESLQNGLSAWSGEWKPRSVDLHGDAAGVKGNVYVVGSDRKLLHHVDTASREGLRQFRFVPSNVGVGKALTEGSSPVPESFGGPCRPLSGLPGGPEQVPGRFVPGGPASDHPRATVAHHDAISSEYDIDSGAWNLIGLSEYLPRDAKLVEATDDLIGQAIGLTGAMPPGAIHSVGTAAQIDASLSEPAGYSEDADAQFIGDMAGRFSAFVSADQVIEVVRRDDFAGHVFDLGTEGGWLSANGIIAGNCRCSIDYEVVPTDQADYSWGGYDDAEMAARATLHKYSEDQARDENGRFAGGGAATTSRQAPGLAWPPGEDHPHGPHRPQDRPARPPDALPARTTRPRLPRGRRGRPEDG